MKITSTMLLMFVASWTCVHAIHAHIQASVGVDKAPATLLPKAATKFSRYCEIRTIAQPERGQGCLALEANCNALGENDPQKKALLVQDVGCKNAAPIGRF